LDGGTRFRVASKFPFELIGHRVVVLIEGRPDGDVDPVLDPVPIVIPTYRIPRAVSARRFAGLLDRTRGARGEEDREEQGGAWDALGNARKGLDGALLSHGRFSGPHMTSVPRSGQESGNDLVV
jgi:hypothetical protein